jgi:glycosyltransferase involved in cell wall biosynthesis
MRRCQETDWTMSNKRPLRVLHILDTLGGGGSERLVWDIVRLSDEERVKHRVDTIFSDGYLLPFVYAEPLRQLGAYGRARPATRQGAVVSAIGDKAAPEPSADNDPSTRPDSGTGGAAQSIVKNLARLPRGVKRPLARIWNAAFSVWQPIRRAAAHVPSALGIPAEYLRFRPDVIHAHGFYGFKYGLLFKALFRTPMVHMVPALFSQMNAQGTGWLADHYRRYHRFVDCFALDPGYRDELLGVGVPAEKLFEINGTLDLPTIARVKADRERHRIEIRARLGLAQNAMIALSVGRLDPTKGHSYAVEALPLMLKQHPDLHWILLGEGATRPELEMRIKELGVEYHAHLLGFDPEPLPYYAAADLYLRTTTMEGENLSSRQAIAMGLPTVGFDSCPETDLISRLGHGLLVPNEDAEALANASCTLLSLPDCGRAVGALGVAFSNENMGIQKHVDSLLSVYAYLQRKGETRSGGLTGLITDR